jgi:hypothetical protein
MIVVKVELWSAIDGSRSELARMMIDNVSGGGSVRSYECRTYRGRSEAALHRAMVDNTVTRKGKVKDHPALKEHIWNLVAKALSGMGYGKESQ